jgi:heme-degrading monooxygenase HmoA
MIVRTWHGRTRIEDAAAYEAFMRERAAPDYGSIPGLRRAVFTRRDEPNGAHFLLITFWDNLEVVKAFAGTDPSKAKYYPEDDRYLLEKEAQSLNHQVFFDSIRDR